MTKSSRAYLNARGITDAVIERYRIGGDEEKIIIPVQGFNKYRTFPKKQYFYDKGFNAALFGLEQLEGSLWCVLTEGELDALRLASVGIPAVSGSGGAKTFKDEWVEQLPKHVFICYDTDAPGIEGANNAHWKIPGSRIVQLPQEFKDVTDYMQEHTKDDFEELIKKSIVVPPPPPPAPTFRRTVARDDAELDDIKRIPITDYVKFVNGKAKCLWHRDGTPSMHYYRKENRVYCFGCGVGGDIVDVIQAQKGVSFREAINILRGH